MKGIVFFLVGVVVPMVLCYDEKYDEIDVDKIIADDALFDAYSKCLLDKGPCDVKYSAEFRKLLPEVVATACGKCSAKQRQSFRKTTRALQDKNPQAFSEFKAIYDPKGDYEQKFMAFMTATD